MRLLEEWVAIARESRDGVEPTLGFDLCYGGNASTSELALESFVVI